MAQESTTHESKEHIGSTTSINNFSILRRKGLIELACGYCQNTPCVKTTDKTMIILFKLREVEDPHKIYPGKRETPLVYATTPDGYSIEVGDTVGYQKFKDTEDLQRALSRLDEPYFIKLAQDWVNSVKKCTVTDKPLDGMVVGHIEGIPNIEYEKEKPQYEPGFSFGRKYPQPVYYMFSYPTIDQLIGLRMLYGNKVQIGEWTLHPHGN